VSVGVDSGQAIVSVSNGSEYGRHNPVLTIRKVDDSGKVVSSFAYEFHRDFHYAIRNYTGDPTKFDKVFDEYQDLEIRQLITILDEYSKAATNAVAFTVMDQHKYPASRIESKIEAIASSLGVELPKGGGQRRSYSNTSYFSNANGNQSGGGGYSSDVGYGSASIDDLE